MKTSTIVVILVVLVGILAGWYALGLPPMQDVRLAPIDGVACTMEAMQCPDGSYVGRSGPNCEFVCPTATTTPPPSGGAAGGGGGGFAEYRSGIRGTVMAGPTCPVERDPPDPNCADRPIETNVQVFRASEPARAIAVTTSSAQGTFEISLPPGNYILKSGPYGVPLPHCNDVSAAVGPNAYTHVSISCDTGIR